MDEYDQKAAGASDAIDYDAALSADILADVTANPIPKKAKKAKKAVNGVGKAKPVAVEYNEADYEPGTGPLPPGAEDGFDPNITLDPQSGQVIYKTQDQRQATKAMGVGSSQTDTLRIHTDGSSLGNGRAGAFAGIGVYFGPGDERWVPEEV